MENGKQSAVEWFGKELESYGDPQFCILKWEELDSLIEQAKEMEKEQRIKGYQLGYDTGYKVCEMKFNGLFKSE